jgi:hypothetical protein
MKATYFRNEMSNTNYLSIGTRGQEVNDDMKCDRTSLHEKVRNQQVLAHSDPHFSSNATVTKVPLTIVFMSVSNSQQFADSPIAGAGKQSPGTDEFPICLKISLSSPRNGCECLVAS